MGSNPTAAYRRLALLTDGQRPPAGFQETYHRGFNMRQTILQTGLILVVACLVTLTSLQAETKTLVLKDGAKVTGEVTEVEDGYEVKTRFGIRKVKRYEVKEILVTLTPEEEYAKLLDDLDESDPDAQLKLGQWAMENGLLAEAKERFQDVLELRSDDEKAQLLLRQVETLLEEARKRQAEEKASEGTTTKPSGTRQPADVAGVDPETLIKIDDIYRIRLAEVTFNKNENRKLRVRFENGVLDRLAASWEGDEDFDSRAFKRRWSEAEQLEYILQRVDRENWGIRDDIDITSEVQFMREYHEVIWPLLRRSCADAACHTSVEGVGGFRLLVPPSRVMTDDLTVRVNYCNFVLLDSYQTKNEFRMIDRDVPKESLLLQFALPPEQAKYKHPPVGGQSITPLLSDKDSKQYKAMLGWLEDSLKGPVHPVYNISYKPLITLGQAADTPAEPPQDGPEEDTPADEAAADDDASSDDQAANDEDD